jgi:hypothetical protein
MLRFRKGGSAIALLLMLLIAIPGLSSENAVTSKRLVLFQGNILHAYLNNKYVEIKRLDPKDSFYGYGWLDDHTVFLAYQREGYAQAIADCARQEFMIPKSEKIG